MSGASRRERSASVSAAKKEKRYKEMNKKKYKIYHTILLFHSVNRKNPSDEEMVSCFFHKTDGAAASRMISVRSI